MNSPSFARPGALLIAVLLTLTAAHAAQASTFVGGTNVLTIIGSPSFLTVGGNNVGQVNYQNNLNVTVTGIVIMLLHNSVGQTVYYTTSTISPPSGENATADLVEFGLPPGTYTATFFAFAFSGIAISTPTSAIDTIPNPG